MEHVVVFQRETPPQTCGGGYEFETCQTAQDLLEDSKPFVPDRVQGSHPEARWNQLIFLSRECGKCALKCGISVVIQERKQTGQVRLHYSEIT